MSLIGISGKIGSGKDTVGDIIRLLTRNVKGDGFNTSHWEINDVIKPNYKSYNPNADSRIYKFEIRKFADKLKDIVCMLIGCTREQLENRDFKEKELGEEWVRYSIKSQYGIESIYNTYEEALKSIRLLNNVSNRVYHKEPYKEYLTPRKILQIFGTESGRDLIHPNIWVNALMNEYKDEHDLSTWGHGEKYPNWIVTDMRFPNEMKVIESKGGITIRVNRPIYLQDNKAGILEPVHESETALDNSNFDYVIENNGSIEELIEKVRKILIEENIL